MAPSLWLIDLRELDGDAIAIKLGDVAGMNLAPGQERFVGEPLKMLLLALEDPTRHPFVMEADGVPAGVLTLQRSAACAAGWDLDDTAWLLRGFLVDRNFQGRGIGKLAAVAAWEQARKRSAALGGQEQGVVLSVNNHNLAARAVYGRAGFVDSGPYLGGNAGPQRIMYRTF